MNNRVPNIQDVALVAGVSTATVSRTLSNPDIVSEKTRDLVFDAIRRTGYSVNRTARNLRRRETGGIVVLVPNLANPFFSGILSGIASAVSNTDYNMLIADTTKTANEKLRIFEYLNSSRADGLIVLDGNLPVERLRDQSNYDNIPPVVFACEWIEDYDGESVRIDNRLGATIAINHLIELGHRSIGHICGPHGNCLTTTRREGAAQAIRDAGLELQDDWFFQGDFSMKSGAEAARQWHALGNRPTAVFCASDEMAFGFIAECHRLGVEIPRDVSVIGFDDVEIAAYFIPPLTTIHQPRREIGKIAAEMLVESIKRNGSDSDGLSLAPQIVPVELIVRESTCPPPGH